MALSKGERAAMALFKEIYPSFPIRTQVPIKYNGTQMFLDLYIPGLRIALEVQGEQHYEDNRFFYPHAIDFKLAKRRDSLKAQYCEDNGITLIILRDTEITREHLAQEIKNALTRRD